MPEESTWLIAEEMITGFDLTNYVFKWRYWKTTPMSAWFLGTGKCSIKKADCWKQINRTFTRIGITQNEKAFKPQRIISTNRISPGWSFRPHCSVRIGRSRLLRNIHNFFV